MRKGNRLLLIMTGLLRRGAAASGQRIPGGKPDDY